jgi:iron-only hydrogenase group A
MTIEIEVNNKKLNAEKGTTILAALSQHGIKIPTLCSMKGFSSVGACRMCVVEVEGKQNLIPACSYPVEEWMKIKTHSQRVLRARKTNVELLLSNHPDDCLYCERNGNCELQEFAEELNIRERRFTARKQQHKLDLSSASLVKDSSKCILCGRCIRVCEEMQGVSAIEFLYRGSQMFLGTAFNKVLNFSSCVACGQCIISCPTGALHEKTYIDDVLGALHDPSITVVAICDASVPVSIAEAYGMKQGKDTPGIMYSALRKLGFNKIFDTSFGADIAIMEESEELAGRLNNNGPFPMVTSSCPSWIKYVEQTKPALFPLLSACKSPQQITGALVKNYYALKEKLSPEKIVVVSISSCIAGKFEAAREEMTSKGIPDVDVVITVREMIQLIKLNGLDLKYLEPEKPDKPFASSSFAGKLFAVSGGELEGTLRTLHSKLTNTEWMDDQTNDLRSQKTVRRSVVKIGDKDLKIAVVSGLGNAIRLLNDIGKGMENYHFIEVMACPGGCIGGGGQPYSHATNLLKTRMNALCNIYEGDSLQVAHRNKEIIELYTDFFKDSSTNIKINLLHTRYLQRDKFI